MPKEAQEYSGDKQQASMANISEHRAKQEWERHSCENCGVDLFVRWYAICIDDFLVNLGKCVSFKVSRWVKLRVLYFFDLDSELARCVFRQRDHVGVGSIEGLQ